MNRPLVIPLRKRGVRLARVLATLFATLRGALTRLDPASVGPLVVLGLVLVVILTMWGHKNAELAAQVAAGNLPLPEFYSVQSAFTVTAAQVAAGAAVLVGVVVALRQLRLAQERQGTSRYSQAVSHLESAQLAVRLGGIYALERLAWDSAPEHQPVLEVLTAYVREHAPWPPAVGATPRGLVLPPGVTPPEPGPGDGAAPPADIQAILTVLGRRRDRHRRGERHPLNLTSTDLRRMDLREAHLEAANLQGTHLEGADLTDAHLETAYFAGANLEAADLARAHLNEAYLYQANLGRAILRFAHLEKANFMEANLAMATLVEANLKEAHLPSSHLEGANLWEANLEGADLAGAHLERANLRQARLIDADLTGAHLEAAFLSDAHLERAFLQESHLEGADLTRARLIDADLIRAHLIAADLTGAHLEGANLQLADLEAADLTDAHLKEANLLEANLDPADLTSDQIQVLHAEPLTRVVA
jgi:uncharacterized protein YjbI with pentapeptide repeats